MVNGKVKNCDVTLEVREMSPMIKDLLVHEQISACEIQNLVNKAKEKGISQLFILFDAIVDSCKTNNTTEYLLALAEEIFSMIGFNDNEEDNKKIFAGLSEKYQEEVIIVFRTTIIDLFLSQPEKDRAIFLNKHMPKIKGIISFMCKEVERIDGFFKNKENLKTMPKLSFLLEYHNFPYWVWIIYSGELYKENWKMSIESSKILFFIYEHCVFMNTTVDDIIFQAIDMLSYIYLRAEDEDMKNNLKSSLKKAYLIIIKSIKKFGYHSHEQIGREIELVNTKFEKFVNSSQDKELEKWFLAEKTLVNMKFL